MIHSSLITQADFFPLERITGENVLLFLSSASIKPSSEHTDAVWLWLPWSSHTSPCLVKCLMGSQLKRGPTSFSSQPLVTSHTSPQMNRGQLPKEGTVGFQGRATFSNFSNKPLNSSRLQEARRAPPLGSRDRLIPLKRGAGRRVADSVYSAIKQHLSPTSLTGPAGL